MSGDTGSDSDSMRVWELYFLGADDALLDNVYNSPSLCRDEHEFLLLSDAVDVRDNVYTSPSAVEMVC